MATTAAFFDLDRTLIASSSAPVFSEQLAAAGVTSGRSIPLQGLFLKLYEEVGEMRATMLPARLAVRASKGWPVDAVAEAAAVAAEEIAANLQPFAELIFEEHRAKGHRLVLATTSPEPLVAAIGEAIGFDDVICTKWKSEDGVYTGEHDGPFVWGTAKADAVAEYAEANDIRMSRSYAYSDSYYDAPMLDIVGKPVAVNPDPQLTATALLKGWKIRHLDKNEGVAKIANREVQDWTRPFMRPELIAPYADIDFTDVDKIPADGGAIIVFNHRSYFDPTVMGLLMAKAGRSVRGLGKKEVFDVPVIGNVLKAIGGIRVERASGSDEPLDRAADALRGGECVMIAPEGTIPRGPAFFDPELKGRWGAAKLAAQTKVPVIPVGIWGTEKVWPRSARLPNIVTLNRPKVTVVVGDPVDLKYRSTDKDTERIMTAISALLPAESQEPYTPTEEELARTYPPGYSGDPTAEHDRRPGTDTSGPDTSSRCGRERIMSMKGEKREVETSERMSEHEALMWNIEKDPWLNASGASLAILDQPVDPERFRLHLRNAVASMPKLYQRVVPGLARLSTPAWAPDPEFDFDYHVRNIELPAPGDQRALLDMAATLYMEPLDRTRPLWRFVTISGLEGGGGAIWSLVHHVIADGIGQMRMAELYQSIDRDAPPPAEVDLEAIVATAAAGTKTKESGGDLASGLVGTVRDTAGHLARRQAGIARRVAGEVVMWPADPRRAVERAESAASLASTAARQVMPSGSEDASGSSLWTERSRHRRLEHVRVQVDDLKAAGRTVGATLNDVFLAGLAEGAHRYHAERNVPVQSFNSSFVVSTREDSKVGGNSFTPVPVKLPAGPMTITERVETIRDLTLAARDGASKGGGLGALSGIVNQLPTSMITRAARSAAGRIDFATSNLRSAPFDLYCAGAKITGTVVMGPVAGTGANITAMSLAGAFDIGIFVDPQAIDEPTELRDHIEAAFADLFDELGTDGKDA